MAYLVRLAIGALLMAATAVSPQSGDKGPVFTNDGSLVFRQVSDHGFSSEEPIRPNGLNDGGVPFPQFQSVYIERENLRHYQKNGKFPEGTVLLRNSPPRKSASIQTGLLWCTLGAL